MPLAATLERIDREFLETHVLPRVNKPGRYLGLEMGAHRKDPDLAEASMVMIFPDMYEIGISNYGHKLLYSLVNNHPLYMCDRAYAPAQDMREVLAEYDIPLYGMESQKPLKSFDLLAFTLQYELNYTTILGILEASKIPFRTENRSDWSTPILIAGGPGSGNPMPLAPFFDAFILGDGEEVLIEVLDLLAQAKKALWSKAETRLALSRLEGVFVSGISGSARKRIVDITQIEVEMAPLIPHIQAVHDRVTIEARRGCDRMCRFCQPCFINLPVREQKIETIRDQALKEIAKTGYEECSLLSLSIADYSQLKPLIHEVADTLREKGVSLSLPSQRADRFDLEVAEAVQQVRKSTLTFAPEAGTERLRNVLNKNLTEPEIMKAVTSSYQAGWNKVKLYFIIGCPTETEADLQGIADLVAKMQLACKQIARETQKSFKDQLDINVTFSNFVPKPHTPFQWVPQATMQELREKRLFLKEVFKGFRGVKLLFTDPEISKLEAVISKGDSRMANVIEGAYRKGAYLDAWSENFEFREWFQSLQEEGIDPDHYTQTTYTRIEESLPWDGIDMGLDKAWLIEEYKKSLEVITSEPCFVGCNTCGVCSDFNVAPVFMKPSEMKTMVFTGVKAEDSTLKLFPKATVKVRLALKKQDQLRFISHLDWLRMLQRAVSRAGFPMAYSQGFNPKPKIVFGPALPLFVEGHQEYIELEMSEKTKHVIERLNQFLPPEGHVFEEKWLDIASPTIDRLVTELIYSARWTCSFSENQYTLEERLNTLLNLPSWDVQVEKKGHRFQQDLKPHVAFIRLSSENTLEFSIRTEINMPQIKPAWLLDLVDPKAVWTLARLKVKLH
jgi:radical SAM-linked protein